MKRKQLLSCDDAIPAKGQHHKPCTDCPWARTALPGWTGSLSPDMWVNIAHADNVIECHVFAGAQCAGAAIYRANVAKAPRVVQLRLPADKEAVFATPAEFINHHEVVNHCTLDDNEEDDDAY